MRFSLLDVLFLMIVLYFSMAGAHNGFIKEVFGKLAFICALLAGVFFCGYVKPVFSSKIHIEAASIICAFLLIFICVFIFVKIIQVILSRIFTGEVLGSLNKSLGFLFGLCEGVLFVCCFLIIIKAQTWFSSDALTDGSVCWQYLRPVLSDCINYVSERVFLG